MAQRRGRGFASMDPEAQRAIASMGGRAAHESGHAHEWNSEEAAQAGHRGGLAAHRRDKPAAPDDETATKGQPAAHRRGGQRAHVDLHGQAGKRRGRQPREHVESANQHAPKLPENEHEQNAPPGQECDALAGDQGCSSS